jgi:hypothetical protein
MRIVIPITCSTAHMSKIFRISFETTEFRMPQLTEQAVIYFAVFAPRPAGLWQFLAKLGRNPQPEASVASNF